MNQTIKGIVLTSRTIFERDKRVELLTLDHGRVTVVAKGAAASVKRFAGRIEPTTVIEASVNTRTSFWSMTDALVIRSFPRIRQSFNHISLAMYFISLVRKVTVDQQPHPDLFNCLFAALLELDHEDSDVAQVRTVFQDTLLRTEGVVDDSYQSRHFARYFSEYTGQMVPVPIIIS